jgi:hypothetical protein
MVPGHEVMHPPEFVPRPTPTQVRTEVQNLLRTRPVEVFRHLDSPHAQLLTPPERAGLARAAIDHLAVQLEVANDAGAAFAQIQAARSARITSEPDVRRGLDVLAHLAEQRCLADGVREVHKLVAQGKRLDASKKADAWLGQLPAIGAEQADAGGLRSQVRETLKDLGRIWRMQAALDILGEAMRAQALLEHLDTVSLPEGLRAPTQGLQGLSVLGSEVERVGGLDAGRVRAAAVQFETALKSIPGADVSLAKQVLQDVAIRAFLEGRPEEYRSLWPANGPPQHAAELLRDLKALSLGSGQVNTWPAERVLTPEPGRGGDNPRGPPPGLRPLVPEGSREGWRPPVKERAGADLPPLEKAAEVGKVLQGQVETAARAEQAGVEAKWRGATQSLAGAAAIMRQQQEDQRKQLAAIEESLRRSLTAAERGRARYLAALNRPTTEIVRTLHKPADSSDEEYLEQIEAILNRPLSPQERRLARALHKEGRSAAAIGTLFAKGDAQGIHLPEKKEP